MGNTAGGISVSFELGTLEHSSDQSTMIEEIFVTQRGARATVPLDETNLTLLQYAFPDGTYVLDAGAVKKKISVGGGTVDKLSAVAYELVIDPVNDSNDNEKITFYKAVASQPVEITLAKDAVRIWAVTFVAIADTTNSAGDQLFLIGDSTATA